MLISQQTRRDWLGVTLAGAALAGLPTLPARAHAPVEGVEFKTLARPQPVESPAGKIEVIEFFGYWCPHCHALEPELMAWRAKQSADVYFRKLPVAFRPNQAPFQHAFFALDAWVKRTPRRPPFLRRFMSSENRSRRLRISPRSFRRLGLIGCAFSN